MRYRTGAIPALLLALLLTAGCSSAPPAEMPAAPPPAAQPTAESPSASVAAGEMALQPEDLPSDYILRDRSVMVAPEVSQLSRDLGWVQGYFVMYDRVSRIKGDTTRVRQSISVFPPDNIKRVYTLEKLTFTTGDNSMRSPNEIPFPAIGDQSMAYRFADTPGTGQVTYTVIFTKKNVFMRITMSGTSTDYETFRDIAQNAVAKIR